MPSKRKFKSHVRKFINRLTTLPKKRRSKSHAKKFINRSNIPPKKRKDGIIIILFESPPLPEIAIPSPPAANQYYQPLLGAHLSSSYPSTQVSPASSTLQVPPGHLRRERSPSRSTSSSVSESEAASSSHSDPEYVRSTTHPEPKFRPLTNPD